MLLCLWLDNRHSLEQLGILQCIMIFLLYFCLVVTTMTSTMLGVGIRATKFSKWIGIKKFLYCWVGFMQSLVTSDKHSFHLYIFHKLEIISLQFDLLMKFYSQIGWCIFIFLLPNICFASCPNLLGTKGFVVVIYVLLWFFT